MAITAEMRTSVLELYTAYFNRAADTAGVDYWLNEMDTNGWSVNDVADTFAQQTEYTDIYAGMDNAAIVAAVYTNVLNRAAETDGAAYWEGELANGNISVSQLVQAVVNAVNVEGADATDAALFDNKITVSQSAYDQNNPTGSVISLAAITSDATTITAVTDATVAAVDAVVNVGETFSLTTSNDTIVGTAKNDTITADKTTWAAVDVVVDGSSTDNDTYTLTMDGNIAAQTVSGVENIDVTIASVTANHTLDTASYAGVTELTVDRADVVVGGATITGGTKFQVNNVDASQVAKITTGGNATVLDINSAATDKAGLVVDATGVTGNVTVQGASTITANDSTASVSIDAVIGNATEDAKAASITAAKAATVSTHASLTGAITIDDAAATTTTVNNAAGGATVTAATAATAAATIAVKGIDNKYRGQSLPSNPLKLKYLN